MSGTYGVGFNSHFIHDIHTIFKRKSDSFMRSTNQVSFSMTIEVNTMNRTVWLRVLQHPFSTISKWNNDQSLTPYRNSCCEFIHFSITDIIGCYIVFYPGIENGCTVDAKQYPHPLFNSSMINMRKRIYPGFRIVFRIIIHAINHTGCSCCCSNFTRV